RKRKTGRRSSDLLLPVSGRCGLLPRHLCKSGEGKLDPGRQTAIEGARKSSEGCPMTKTKHSKMGKRLIAAMKEVVDHVEGRTALPMRYVEVPEDVDVRAIRSKLGLSQEEFSRRDRQLPSS